MAVKHDLGVVPASIGHAQLALFFVTHAEHDALGCATPWRLPQVVKAGPEILIHRVALKNSDP